MQELLPKPNVNSFVILPSNCILSQNSTYKLIAETFLQSRKGSNWGKKSLNIYKVLKNFIKVFIKGVSQKLFRLHLIMA